MRIISVVGARPQIIKCAAVSKEIRKSHKEILVHTGQHYDDNMSDIFFKELNIPEPDYNLGVGSGTHAEQTGKMLIELEKVYDKENPDLVVVYGDTNTTLAGALAASKMQISVAHVESGLRSFDMTMPEEINRIAVDHISTYLLCPTTISIINLSNEGLRKNVYNIGDVTIDTLEEYKTIAESSSNILEKIGIEDEDYLVLTVHRQSNTDNAQNLSSILNAVGGCGKKVIFPAHPRVREACRRYDIDINKEKISQIDPLGYLDMLKLMAHADKVITDSGGIQKEAYVLGVPCVTLRTTTEWTETLCGGWNVLVGTDQKRITTAIKANSPTARQVDFFRKGASKRFVTEFLKGVV